MSFKNYKSKHSHMDAVPICPKCDALTETYNKKKGDHNGLYCKDCDSWIKWLPKEINPERDWKNYTMPFGKHQGKKLTQIPDGYLKWAAENFDDDEVLSKMFKYALESKSKKKVRPKFPVLNEKDVYNIVDHETNEVLTTCLLTELTAKAKEIWPKYIMPHAGFILVENEIVGRVEFKHKYNKKPKQDELTFE